MVCSEWLRQYKEWLERERKGGGVKKKRVDIGRDDVPPGNGKMPGGVPVRRG